MYRKNIVCLWHSSLWHPLGFLEYIPQGWGGYYIVSSSLFLFYKLSKTLVISLIILVLEIYLLASARATSRPKHPECHFFVAQSVLHCIKKQLASEIWDPRTPKYFRHSQQQLPLSSWNLKNKPCKVSHRIKCAHHISNGINPLIFFYRIFPHI